MTLLVVLVAAVAVVLLVMRAAAAPGGGFGRGPGGGARPGRPVRAPRTGQHTRTVGPEDDPDFLRELERRARRDDTSA